jgi:subtilisin
MNVSRVIAAAVLLVGVSVSFTQAAPQGDNNGAGQPFAPGEDTGPGQVVPGSYIVSLRAGAKPEAVSARHGIAARYHYRDAANGFAADLPAPAFAALLKDDDVDYIVVNREIYAIGKPVASTPTTSTQVIPAGVRRIGALGCPYTGMGVGVAVVDTGIDLANTDLLFGSKSYSAISASAKDDNGHGTHVAGIIGAVSNTIGVVGVAPQARVYAVKVLDRYGSGTDASIIAGLDWVARNAATVTPTIKVVNMSLGRPGTLADNPVLRQAVQKLVQLGIKVIVAAGNDSATEVSQQVPATYPEVIAVASTTALKGTSLYPGFSGIVADVSSFFTTDGALLQSPDGTGYIGVTISAPGEDQENVSSTGGITTVGILSLKVGGGTTRMSGTSMAAPHVAGVAAILQQKYGATLTTEAARSKIIAGASNLVAPYDSPTAGYTYDGDREGIVDVPGALAAP